MPSPFAITTTANTVPLDGNRQGQASFTVTNTTPNTIRGRAHVVAQPVAAEPWLKLAGEAERDFANAGSQQYVVQIAVPPSTSSGDYTLRLDMVDVANPDDNFSQGQPVTFMVPVPPPPPYLFPWWIVAVVAAIVILVGGGSFGVCQVVHNNNVAEHNAQGTATAVANAHAQGTATAVASLNATATAVAMIPQTPIQLSPANGSIFSNFPRTTLLQWSSVNAFSYTVELDCFQCCAINRWCTDVGAKWRLTSNIRQTSYQFDFVGAQPGRWRWRVFAVSASGQRSPVSGWWTFTYMVRAFPNLTG
jgi:hypothetical protein